MGVCFALHVFMGYDRVKMDALMVPERGTIYASFTVKRRPWTDDSSSSQGKGLKVQEHQQQLDSGSGRGEVIDRKLANSAAMQGV